MKPEIKSVALWGHGDVRRWRPPDPSCVAEELFVDIGPKGNKKSDSFRIRVATPAGLEALEDRDGVIAVSPLLILRRFDVSTILKWLDQTAAKCEAPSWAECVEKLKVYFGWEYQGMT